MKHLKKLAFLLIIALGMVSCSLLNVDVDTTMSGVMNIDVEESLAKSSVQSHHFYNYITLNPQDDADVKKYAKNIVDVGVGNITATVVTVTANDVVVVKNGTVTISATGKTDATYTLKEDWAIIKDASFQLEDQDGFYKKVSAILKDVEPFDIEMDGYSTVSGVTIKLKFSIDATVTGSPF